MFQRLKHFTAQYPRQFWVLFVGQLISVSGTSMVWPFLTIYLRERLQVPLVTITSLFGIESLMTVVATLIVGPFMDRFGRKRVLVTSIIVNCLTFLLMTQAHTLLEFALLITVRGLFAPLFRVGSDTMVTDLTPEERRAEAFSLTRTSTNVGFAIGPAVGGFIAATSFQLSLYIGAGIMGLMALVTLLGLKETLARPRSEDLAQGTPLRGGYLTILHDRPFLLFLVGDLLVRMGMVTMFSLLSVYAKENFAVPENQFGFIMTVNAVMAATLQFATTRITRRFPPTLMLALGAAFYAAGLGSVALGDGFFDFVISMVIMTTGELILMPTALSLVAKIAPARMRGRYMSSYSLTMAAGKGLGPMIGGALNDQIAPAAMWYGAMLMGLASSGIFLLLHRFFQWEMTRTRVIESAD